MHDKYIFSVNKSQRIACITILKVELGKLKIMYYAQKYLLTTCIFQIPLLNMIIHKNSKKYFLISRGLRCICEDYGVHKIMKNKIRWVVSISAIIKFMIKKTLQRKIKHKKYKKCHRYCYKRKEKNKGIPQWVRQTCSRNIQEISRSVQTRFISSRILLKYWKNSLEKTQENIRNN